MNYYERHLGDYAKDTGHLSILEHGVYTLLLDRYYATESPIPADKAYRWCMARSREERSAVDAILAEFFVRDGDEWYNNRADSDIARFRAQVPEKEEKKRNAKERQVRARKRRAELFEQLRDLGVTMPFRSTTEELVTELSRVTVTVVTATQTPDTRHQSPDTNKSSLTRTPCDTSTSVSEQAGAISPSTAVCVSLRKAGVTKANPQHPDLLAALDEGVQPRTIIATALEGKDAGKGDPFLWGIATARSRHAQGPKPIQAGNHANLQPGRKLSAVEQVEHEIRQRRAAEGESDDGQDIPRIAG